MHIEDLPPTCSRPPSYESMFHTSQHLPTYNANGTRIVCTRCRAKVTLSRPKEARQWLESPCQAIGTDRERPVPINFDNLVIGTQTIHSSHKVFTFKVLIHCQKCGGHAGTGHRIDKLSERCTPGETISQKRWGKQVVDNIQAGKLPHGVLKWPYLDG